MTTSLAPSRLLPPPAPPHDPFSIMLSGRIGPGADDGWRPQTLQRIEIDTTTRALVLGPAPAAARLLTEPSGSFGGLRLPPNVAATAAGDLFLLDPATGELHWFDRCECRFVALRCFTRGVSARAGCEKPEHGAALSRPSPTELSDPRAIAICGGDLFVADRGHHRVLRFALGAMLPRGTLRLPAAERAKLAGGLWHPGGLAVDGCGAVTVSDEINGRLDRFDARGRWARTVAVGPGVTHVAIDCGDRVYAVIERDLQENVTVGAGPVALEIDAQNDGVHWQTLRLSALSAGARFAIDIHVSDEVWTPLELNDPANTRWTRWLDADRLARATQPMPLAGALGRFLRLRLVPQPAHVPGPPFDAIVHAARAVRVTGTSIEALAHARADRVDGFSRLPVLVTQAGRLQVQCATGSGSFDLHGRPGTDRLDTGQRFERTGTFVSRAIDSGIDGCLWHRVELRGDVPAGCSIEVQTTTAAIELTRGEIDALPASAWCTRTIARVMDARTRTKPQDCAWDTLVFSPPGRYLWLRLIFRGDGRATPCVSSALIEYPRISLRRYLPGVFGADPVAADFTDRFTAIFDRTLRSIEAHLDRLPMLFDPMSAPATAVDGNIDFLSWLADWIGISLARDWPEERRRRYVRKAGRLYCMRGTPAGLWQQLLLLLGFDVRYGKTCLAERPQRRCVAPALNCRPCPACVPAPPPPLILEHFKLRRWLYAGHGRLGSDSVLWGKRIVNRSELSGDGEPATGNAQVGVTQMNTVPDPLRDPFHVHAHGFSVFVPSRVRESEVDRRALEQLLAREAPAHTRVDIRYVEPRFRVGVQATIGLDAVVARTPRGVVLGGAALRRGTVISGRRVHGPQLQVGEARVGTTTRLT